MDKIFIVDIFCGCLYTLKYFFKEKFYMEKENLYIIPTRELLALKRELFPKIDKGHGEVCGESKNICNPHKFKNYIQQISDFLEYSVEKEGVFYDTFEFFPDNGNTDFFGWTYKPVNKKCIKHLSWSRRLQYLN